MDQKSICSQVVCVDILNNLQYIWNMDEFVAKRSLLVSNIDLILENLSSRRESKKNDGDDLFGFDEQSNSGIILGKNIKNLSKMEALLMEKEILGLYISGNPLYEFEQIQQKVRYLLNDFDIHLVLIEKIRKVFTRSNAMMIAMDVTTPTENIEAVVYTKYAMQIAPFLVEKKMFWFKGKIRIPEQKNNSEISSDLDLDTSGGEVREFVESVKIVVNAVSAFENGVADLFDDEIDNMELESIDWVKLAKNPLQLERVEMDGTGNQVKKLVINKKYSIAKIAEIKSKMTKQKVPASYKLEVFVEHNDQVKQIPGEFWMEKSYFDLL
jgi:DNA polymerase III alpha subunit